MFLMKNKALTEIAHANINKLKETFKDDSQIGLLLELAKGVSLSELLHSFHSIPSSLIKIIVFQLIQIFEYLHANNYVYKDLKASHVFLNKNGHITLIDLGMIEKLKPGSRSHIPAGTFHMMAPEMIDLWESLLINSAIDKEKLSGYNQNIDLYAIGVLIYELLLGKPPFDYLQATASNDQRLKYFENTREEINHEKLKDRIDEKIGVEINEVDEGLIDLMLSLLSKDEGQRLGSNNNFDALK